MMYPVVGAEYDAMAASGQEVFRRWDGRYLAKVGHRRPNYQALYVLWLLKFIEFLYHGLLEYLDLLYLAIVSLPLYVLCWLPVWSTSDPAPATPLPSLHHSFLETNMHPEESSKNLSQQPM